MSRNTLPVTATGRRPREIEIDTDDHSARLTELEHHEATLATRMGITPEQRKRNRRMAELKGTAERCYSCDTDLADEVWRIRTGLGHSMFGGWRTAIYPYCRDCVRPRMRGALWPMQCPACKRAVYHCEPRRARYVTCSESCAKQARVDRRRLDRQQLRAARPCDQCGAEVNPSRSDARLCSSACRQAAYRARTRNDTG